MTLNLDKNREPLITSWKEVVDEKSETNWVLYGYDGQTFDLNLVGKGDGGLDELADEFNSGKIQYALARVKIKEKNVEKIVLINWQGEGAPLSRKGMCANHISIVRSFFKGIHVTMNARTDEDVEPDLVIQNIAKAIAGEGVTVLQQTTDTPVGPVGTCYKKTNPREEINSVAKDEFWKKEEQEEERRKRDEQNKLRRFSQNEVKLLRRESQDYFNDDSKNEVSNVSNNSNGVSKVSPTPPVVMNGSASNGKLNGSSWMNGSSTSNSNGTSPVPQKEISAASAAAVKASTPLKNSTSSDLVRQRIKSFDNGQPVTGAVNGTNGKTNGSNAEGERLSVMKRRALFENGGASNITSTVQRRNPSLEIKEAQQKASPPTKTVPTPPQQQQHEQQHEQQKEQQQSPPPKIETSIVPSSLNGGTVVEEKVVGCGGIQRSVSPQMPPSVTVAESPSLVNKVVSRSSESPARSPVPPPVPSSPAARASPIPPASVPSPQPQIQIAAPPGFEDSMEGQPESLDQSETITIEITPEMGLCARALYDYQAADETEITFDPGEIITNIERIDEGWWEGLGPRGVYGLFPANYVELLN